MQIFQNYILDHLKTQCVTIDIGPYQHMLCLILLEHQISLLFPFTDNIQCISNHLFSHEYDTLGHIIEANPKVDFDIVNAHETIRHDPSHQSNDRSRCCLVSEHW